MNDTGGTHSQDTSKSNPWDVDPLAGSTSDDAVAYFMESTEDSDFCGPYRPEVYFEPMFRHWLTEDRGLKVVHGSFAVFIVAALRVIDIVQHNPDELTAWRQGGHGPDRDQQIGPLPRRVLGIFDPSHSGWHCFDQQGFEAIKFNYIMLHATSDWL